MGHGCGINSDSQLTRCLFIIHLPSLNELQRNAYSENMLGEDLIFVNNGVIDRKEFQNKWVDITTIFQKENQSVHHLSNYVRPMIVLQKSTHIHG